MLIKPSNHLKQLTKDLYKYSLSPKKCINKIYTYFCEASSQAWLISKKANTL
jgi:hypothetical protein